MLKEFRLIVIQTIESLLSIEDIINLKQKQM